MHKSLPFCPDYFLNNSPSKIPYQLDSKPMFEDGKATFTVGMSGGEHSPLSNSFSDSGEKKPDNELNDPLPPSQRKNIRLGSFQ